MGMGGQKIYTVWAVVDGSVVGVVWGGQNH